MHALCTPRDTPIHQSHTGISVLEFFYKRRAIECLLQTDRTSLDIQCTVGRVFEASRLSAGGTDPGTGLRLWLSGQNILC